MRCGLACCLALALSASPALAWSPTHRVKTSRGQVLLRLHSDRQLHFAYLPAERSPLEVAESPLWDAQAAVEYRGGGPLQEVALGEVMPAQDSTVQVYLDPVTRQLALEIRQAFGEGESSFYRFDFAEASGQGPSTFRLRAPRVDALYGLGEHFPPQRLGQADGDLLGLVRDAGSGVSPSRDDQFGVFGNAMVPLDGGAVGNALFPVLHLIDHGGPDALLFLDNPARSRWDFRTSPWRVEVHHGEISGVFRWGQESRDLRRHYLTWTGRPPVPPRKALGLWVSEYGYEHWGELEDKERTLRESGFPVDGFVLDLQWFGGIQEGSPESRMGSLAFDTAAFPRPAETIRSLAQRGLGLVVIEEAYIAAGLPEYADLAGRGYLVRSPEDPAQPHWIDETPWWGVGSMLDYLHPEAGAYWHRTKREPLRQMGILGHWTDLGEPEMFRRLNPSKKGKTSFATPLYYGGLTQGEANNLFALSWVRSIYEGFGAERAVQRPWILARTGTSGIQRFGTALWSGDIASTWESLRSHYRAQSHVAMSGVDYFGSDVGGFYRRAFREAPGGYDELYTRWFAAACLTDVPLRPHVMNLSQSYESAPDRVGHRPSNLANLRQRYRLIPYLYSAAHRAYWEGEAVVAPPVLYHQGQGALDRSGTHKWLGQDMLARLVLEPDVERVAVTFPPGRWYDFESGLVVSERGGETLDVAAREGEWRKTPLFALGGSVIPVGSEETSECSPEALELLVFPGTEARDGVLYEDDGWSQAYRAGEVSRTRWRQSAWQGRFATLTIEGRVGAWGPSQRDLTLRVASPRASLQALVDGQEVPLQREGSFWVLHLPQRPASQDTVIHFR